MFGVQGGGGGGQRACDGERGSELAQGGEAGGGGRRGAGAAAHARGGAALFFHWTGSARPRRLARKLRHSRQGPSQIFSFLFAFCLNAFFQATQDAPPSVRAEDRFWTKFCGVLQPMSRIPVVEVIHAVRAK